MEDILLKIGEYLVDPTIRQLRYLFHFKSIVEDLKKESEKLRSKQATLQRDVRIAEQKTEEIKEDVRKWLSNVEGVMKEVQNLKEKIQIDKHCLCGWCPNMIWRYNLGKDAMKKTATIREFHDEKFDRISYPTRPEFIPSQETHFESTKSAFNQIMEALESDECNMIGLYGIGGVGKTTLAEGVRKRAKELNLFDNLVKVVVSQNPDFTRIQDEIAEWLGVKIEDKGNEARASRLSLILKKEKKILIILDDVWGDLDLAKGIGIPFGDDQKGCKILITTRRLHVCNVMGCKKNIPLNTLSKEDAWALFKESSGLDDNSPTLNDVAMKVAEECKGLPLAIVAVGRALKGKTSDKYKQAFKKLKSSKLVHIEGVDTDVYPSLRLSYDFLKEKETKSCFLLCSLFPEDYKIDIEDLARYVMGLGLFENIDSIEDARSQLRAIIDDLKDSSLLLEGSKQQFVRMHDVVRDVALWIASKEENVFMVRAGVGLEEWPKEERFEQYTAISLMANKIKVLPSKLDCPRLEILLLGGEASLIVPEKFFEGMKALKVLTLSHGSLFPQSLEFLTNLRVLGLMDCKFRDISSLGKLKRLEVLRFRGSFIEELPSEVGELNNLRLLDLSKCWRLERIPPDVLQRLSLLEELYIGSNSFKKWEIKGSSLERCNASFKEWEIKGSSLERYNASISELNSLSRLAMVSMELNPECLPQDFYFHNLLRYDIVLNKSIVHSYSFDERALDYPQSRQLGFYSIDVSSKVNAFKELFSTVEYLNLEEATGFKNIIPNMYQESLKDLISLSLVSCGEMECLIDSTQLRGPTQHVSLQSLRDVKVSNCRRLTCLFSSSLARSMVQLQTLEILGCGGLEQIIITEKEDGEISSEAHLQPCCFPKLRTLKITNCAKLEYIFPISVARGLQLLEVLIISNAPQLKHVFGHGREEDENDIVLPQLRKLELRTLSSLTSFYEGNCHWMWPSLQELTVVRCPKLSTSFITDVETNLLALQKQLRVLRIGNRILLAKAIILLQRQSLQKLEELVIENCEGVQEIFHGVSTDRDDELSVSNLKELYLEDVPELRVIWKGPTQISSFQNLTLIKIVGCNKLKHIFSASVARNLQRLEYLRIWRCEELERMIGEDEEDEIISVKPHLQQQPIRFPNLKTISVKDCHKLKSLFPITIARGLPQLEDLWVERASELEEVFRHENEEDLRDENKILLQRLRSLGLVQLPRLISFCPGGYHFIFPSLDSLDVNECPNITTSFTIASDLSVHAKAKAKVETPQLVKEDMPEGSSTPQATVVTMCSHNNIDWHRHRFKENPLPPYVEESAGNL